MRCISSPGGRPRKGEVPDARCRRCADCRGERHGQPAADDDPDRGPEWRGPSEAGTEHAEQRERDEDATTTAGMRAPGRRHDDREQSGSRTRPRRRRPRPSAACERTGPPGFDDAELVAEVGGERVGAVELDRDLAGELRDRGRGAGRSPRARRARARVRCAARGARARCRPARCRAGCSLSCTRRWPSTSRRPRRPRTRRR